MRSASISFFLIFSLLTIAAAGLNAQPQLVKDAYPGFSTGSLSLARITALPKGVILRAGTLSLTQKDLNTDIAKAPVSVRPQLKRNLFFMLEQRAAMPLLLSEAKTWAKSGKPAAKRNDDELLRAYFMSLVEKLAVSDDEAKSFFDKNKDMIGQATYDQVKDQINEYLLDQKRQEALDAHIASIGARTRVEVDAAWVAKQYSAAMDNPIDKARKSGKPTMAELGSDDCQPCVMMRPVIESLKKDFAGRVNVLYVDVSKEQVLAARYGVQSIPVQVFFDRDGKEIFRHVGFFPKEEILAKFAEMGVK